MEKARKSGNKNMKYSEAFEEFVADSMEKMLTDQNAVEKLAMLRTKDKSVFDKLREGIQKLVDRIKQEYAKLTPDSAEGRTVATMTDVFSDIQDLFLEALDDASNNFQKYENEDSFEKSSIDTERSVKYSNKTRYDEFASFVMRWAYSASTEVGDTKIFANKSGKFSLFEKTETGYIEITRGNYKKVRAEYERANNDTDKEFYEYSNKIRSERNRSMRNNISTEDGENVNRSIGQVRSKGLQTDTTGNNEHLQSGDKGKSIKFSLRKHKGTVLLCSMNPTTKT